MTADPHASVALDRLFEITVRLGDAMQRDAVQRGLTRARAGVLWELRRVGPVTQRELSEAMRVTPRNVTGLVDGLSREGLVARRPHPTDRRATLVDLTPAGGNVVNLLGTAYQQFTGFLFDDMASVELKQFAAALERVLDRLRAADFNRVRREALVRHLGGTQPANVAANRDVGAAPGRVEHPGGGRVAG